MHDCLIINLQILKSYSLLSTEVNVLPIERRKKKVLFMIYGALGRQTPWHPWKGLDRRLWFCGLGFLFLDLWIGICDGFHHLGRWDNSMLQVNGPCNLQLPICLSMNPWTHSLYVLVVNKLIRQQYWSTPAGLGKPRMRLDSLMVDGLRGFERTRRRERERGLTSLVS